MASEWICYLDEQEFGPISEADLMELIREGTIPVNSYIRRPTDPQWTTIQEVFGTNILKRQETSPQRALTPSAESRLFTDSPTLVNLPSSTAGEWYWHVAGETFGPGNFEMLSELCEQGLISPDDFVRMGLNGEWTKASAVESLFPASTSFVDAPRLSSPPPAPPPGIVSSATVTQESAGMIADETKLLQQLLELLQKNPSLSQLGARPTVTSAIPPDQQWFCMVSGQEVGPVTIETLVQMVLQGRVFSGDLIRLGTTGEWFPASSVEELFPSKSPSPGVASVPSLPVESDSKSGQGASEYKGLPETEMVLRGLDRLYKASEKAAEEMAEKELKAEKSGEKKKEVGSSTSPSASRNAANDIIKNYSQFAITSAEKKKAEELANKVSLKEQIAQNKVQIIVGVVALAALAALCVFLMNALAP